MNLSVHKGGVSQPTQLGGGGQSSRGVRVSPAGGVSQGGQPGGRVSWGGGVSQDRTTE